MFGLSNFAYEQVIMTPVTSRFGMGWKSCLSFFLGFALDSVPDFPAGLLPADPAFESFFLFSIPTLDLEAASSHRLRGSNPHAYPNFYTHGIQTRASCC